MGQRSSGYPASDPESAFSRFAYTPFLFIAILAFFVGVQFLISPLESIYIVSLYTHIPDDIITGSQSATTHALLLMIRFTGTFIVGLSLLTISIAYYSFRNSHRWAWYALLLWPLLFLSHYFIFSKDSAFSALNLILAALALLALGLKLPSTFKKKRKKKRKAPALVN